MSGDLPTISNYMSTSNTYVPGSNLQALGTTLDNTMAVYDNGTAQGYGMADALAARGRRLSHTSHNHVATLTVPTTIMEDKVSKRIVQVFIIDPNENVPIENSLLYSDQPHMTDMNDQELFFELDIKAKLEAHNAKRVKLVDKKVKERTEYLEPARIRDLKMVVVDVAKF